MSTLPAAAIKVRDVVRLDGKVVTITSKANGEPKPGITTLTDTANRAFGLGASTLVEVVDLP